MQDYFARLAQVESGGNPLAQNPKSSAKGMFQFVDSTAKQYGITAPFGTPEYAMQEIEAVKKFTEDNRKALTETLGRDPTKGELYLAHQQGAAGAAKILTNPDFKITDLVGQDEALLNAATPDMTAKDFAQNWTGKFDDLQNNSGDVFSVKLPDGTVVKNIPIGTTKEQIKAKLAAGGYDVSKLEPRKQESASFVDKAMSGDISTGAAPEALPTPEPEQRQAGFVQRVGEAYANRLKNVGESLQNYDDQYLLETAAQAAGQGFGAVGDVLGNALISGYRYLPESSYGLGEGVGLVGSIPTGGDKTLADRALGGLQYATDQWREFKAENPRAARNLGAVGNIGAALIPIKGANAAGKVGTTAGKTVQTVSKVVDAMIPRPEDVTPAMMGATKSAAYKLASDLGGTLSPNYTKNLSQSILGKIDEFGGTLPKGSQDILRSMSDKEGVVREAVDLIKSLDGQPLTLEGFEAIDKTIGGLRFGSGVSEPAARKLGIIQKELRKVVDNAGVKDIAGGAGGFEAYRKATALAAKEFKMQELAEMTAKAFNTQQPVNSLKKYLKAFLEDPDIKKFNDAEIAAIREVAESDAFNELFRGLSNRGSAIIALATNPQTAPALAAGSYAVRTVRQKAITRKMQEINNLIATGDKGTRSLPTSALMGVNSALGKGGEMVEKAFGGKRGQLSTLGLLQQLQAEQERNQQQQ